jgi:hypothetical protein
MVTQKEQWQQCLIAVDISKIANLDIKWTKPSVILQSQTIKQYITVVRRKPGSCCPQICYFTGMCQTKFQLSILRA